MTERIILYLIIGGAVSLAISYLTKGTGGKPDANDNGKYTLRMNRLYQFVGVFGLLVGLLFLIILPFKSNTIDGGLIFVIFLMVLIFLGTGIPCLLYYNNHRLTFDNELIIVTNFKNKTRTIKWSELRDMNFSHFSGLLTLTSDKETIKIHQHLVGLSKFMEVVEAKTNWTAKQLKLPIEK